MKRSLKLPLYFGLAAVFAAVAISVGVSQLRAAADENQTLLTWEAPGSGTFSIAEAGRVAIWHDHRTFHNGTSVNEAPELPSGVTISMVLADSNQVIPFIGGRSTQTINSGSVAKQSVGSFDLPRGGDYQVTATFPPGETRILSVTDGGLGAVIKHITIGLGSAFLLSLVALVFLILGVLAIFKKPTPNPPPLIHNGT